MLTKVWNKNKISTNIEQIQKWSSFDLCLRIKRNKILWLLKQKSNGIFCFCFWLQNWLFPRLARKRSVAICINIVTFRCTLPPCQYIYFVVYIIWFCLFKENYALCMLKGGTQEKFTFLRTIQDESKELFWVNRYI